MHKILIFIGIALVSHIPLDVLADGKLQTMSNIVKHMNTSRLCEYDCEPVIKVDGTNLTVCFETKIADGVDTNALCQCMKDYMKGGVGDATAECEVNGNEFAIAFHGEYDPNAKPLPPLTTLSMVLSNYDEPDLGGYKCTKEISERDGRIYIKITYKGNEYKSACAGILKYLNQNELLDGARNKCSTFDRCKKAVLDLWADK